MTLGFTGTHLGMKLLQRNAVKYLFSELQLTVLHHGDCVGSDAQAHKIAQSLRARIVIHPPVNDKWREFCTGFTTIYRPLPYLKRNQRIVEDGCDGLIATPHTFGEVLRSGTWATIRYARKRHRRIWIIWPDGTFREENNVTQIDGGTRQEIQRNRV